MAITNNPQSTHILAFNEGTPACYTRDSQGQMPRLCPAPLSQSEPRVVFNLQDSPDHSLLLPRALSHLGFDAEKTLSTLTACLVKKEDPDNRLSPQERASRGQKKLYQLCEKGKITIERVGYRKDKSAKLYLVVRNPLGRGSYHDAYLAISLKGNARILIEEHQEETFDTGYDIQLSKKLKNTPVSRVMSSEPRLKVVTRGTIDLIDFFNAEGAVSKEERLIIYTGILQGIKHLHELGFVHGDNKLENNTVMLDEKGDISGTLLIDTHNLTRIGIDQSPVGSSLYLSPERLMETYLYANPKDDVWATMYIICSIECAMPENERLLSPKMIERFEEYQRQQEAMGYEKFSADELFARLGAQPNTNTSLFNGCVKRGNAFDVIVFAMAFMNRKKRPEASQALQQLQQYMTPTTPQNCPSAESELVANLQKELSTISNQFQSNRKDILELEKEISEELNELRIAYCKNSRHHAPISNPQEIEQQVLEDIESGTEFLKEQMNNIKKLAPRIRALPESPEKIEMRSVCQKLWNELTCCKKILDKDAEILDSLQRLQQI